MVLAPDEHQAAIYADDLHANMKPGAALAFAHGLNIHFGLIEPRTDIDVIMIAPKAQATPYAASIKGWRRAVPNRSRARFKRQRP